MVLVAGWFIVATVAYGGGVHVDDTCGCLKPEIVELELRTAIGDDVVDRVDLRVKLSGDDHWRLELEVLDGNGSLWNRNVAVEPADCPYLTALITQSVERGLADLPGWDLAFRRRPVELGGTLSVTAPWAFRVGFAVDLWIPIRGAFHWQIQPDFVYGLVEEYEIGTAQLQGGAVGTGPGFDLPTGSGAVRIAARFAAGATLVNGKGSVENFSPWAPRALVVSDVGWAAPTGIRSAVRLEIPIARLSFGDGVDGTVDPVEPPIRLGVVVGIAGPLRRSDVRGSERR